MDNELLKIAILRNLFMLNLRQNNFEAEGTVASLQSNLGCERWNHFEFSLEDFWLCVKDCHELELVDLHIYPEDLNNIPFKIFATKKGESFANHIFSLYYIEEKGLVS